MSVHPATPIEVDLQPCPALSQLAPLWSELQTRADASFFTSWAWIGSWLAALEPTCRLELLQARRDGRLLGLALIGRTRQVRLGLIHSRRLHLNSAGCADPDGVTIEYNDLLLDRTTETEVRQAIQHHLLRTMSDWDEFVLPGTTRSPEALADAGLVLRAEAKPTFQVDLAAVREACATGRQYADLLSAQTRYRLRKTSRAAQALGPLQLDEAADTAQALDFLAGLKALHQPYWQARGMPGAFASAFSNRFHDALLRNAHPQGGIQLLRISIGGTALAYLYNFVFRGRVCNYQSGINYELLKGSVSPGLLCHALAVDHNRIAGHDVYDLMAGEHRYKRELCTREGQLHWSVAQRPRLSFRMEDQLRRLKRRLLKGRSAAAAPATPASAPAVDA